MRLDGSNIAPPTSVYNPVHGSSTATVNCWWGGWGSNPRPEDYEKCGPALRARHLHRYHGIVPPTTLIALYARVPRSTDRSTPYRGDYQRARARRRKAARGEPDVANRRALDLDCE